MAQIVERLRFEERELEAGGTTSPKHSDVRLASNDEPCSCGAEGLTVSNLGNARGAEAPSGRAVRAFTDVPGYTA